MTRSPYKVRCEILFSCLLPWRSDLVALAVTKPWDFWHGLLARGECELVDLAVLMLRGSADTHGVVCASWAARRRAKVTATMDMTRWTAFDGAVLDNPLAQPRQLLRTWLLRAFRGSQLASLRTHLGYQFLSRGADYWATNRVFNAALPRSTLAALRAVMVGSMVTQSIACKWQGGPGTCPFCTMAVESPWHRLWECDAWYWVRRRHLGDWTVPRLLEILGPSVMLTGILPPRPFRDGPWRWPPQVGVPTAVYTDGSSLDPADPALRVAAWSAVWPGRDEWVGVNAQCPGRQTVG